MLQAHLRVGDEIVVMGSDGEGWTALISHQERGTPEEEDEVWYGPQPCEVCSVLVACKTAVMLRVMHGGSLVGSSRSEKNLSADGGKIQSL